jgi:hypothetical protein
MSVVCAQSIRDIAAVFFSSLSRHPRDSSHGDQRRNATRAVASWTHCPLIACTHGSLSKYTGIQRGQA